MQQTSIKSIYKSKTPKVYKHKKLNSGNFSDFNLNDYRVFLHLVSKLGNVDEFGKYIQTEKLQREHILTAKEFAKTFNVSIDNCYLILKSAVDKLMKTDITLEKLELSETWRINVCSRAKYNQHKGYISVKFTDDIMPYLAQMKEKFILYNLKEVSYFNSIYSTKLYELIQEFKETGWVLKSVDQLREIFAVGNKLKAYKDFKKYTFLHACQEINNVYNIDLNFEEMKEGHKVTSIKFTFKKATIKNIINRQTGKVTKNYIKPKPTDKADRVSLLKDPHTLVNSTQEVKPLKLILNSILSKFKFK